MAVSGKGKGKAKSYESDEGKKAPDKGKKKAPLDKGKKIVRDDDEEEDYENTDEYIVDEAEEGYSSEGDGVRVTRAKRQKRFKKAFELDEDDYDLLDEANVTGFHRPANLGGKFKRLKKAGHVSGRKNPGAELEEKGFMEDEDGHEDEDEEMEDDEELDDVERDEYKLISKPLKKGGRRGAQKRRKGSKTSLGQKRRAEEALASLNEVDSDDNDDNDQDLLSRALLDTQFYSNLPEATYFSPRDDQLRQTDIPERLQILEEAAESLPSSDSEFRQAAEWIYDRAFGDLCIPSRAEFQFLSNVEKSEIVRQIANVLRLVHNEKMEVPFIGLYRREECSDLLNEEPKDIFSSDEGPTILQYKALWAVQEWNKKWLLLQRRKSELQRGFKERVPVDTRSTPELNKLVNNIYKFIADAESEQAVDDFEAQFKLHFPINESEVLDSRFKRPKIRSEYSIAHQAGVGSITKHFGIPSDAFAENVKAGFKKHDVLDAAFLPNDLATKFSSSSRSAAEFRDPASLIRGAVHMLAVEISSEPAVRNYVRTFFSKNAVVTTKPTLVGINAIGAFHQFEGVKWINDKPTLAFDDEQWLLIQKAEEEKLIDVTIGLSKESSESLLFDCEQLYLSNGDSPTSVTWNEQRKLILQEAVALLLPIMEKETRMRLVSNAKQLLVAKCGLLLWNKVSLAPYDPASPDCRDEEGPTLRVLACCWGPFNTGTTFVMLDADGSILNVMRVGYLNIRALTPEQTQRKENDKARLLKVLTVYRPQIIVLGAAKVQCRYLNQDISDVLVMFAEKNAEESTEGLDNNVKLVYGDESIPSLFETSKVSLKQLPGHPGTVRRAVALGRFLQNPVAMVASLFGPAREILSFKLHPLQCLLSGEELYDVLERVMITVVNQVGIDINFALKHDWLLETLQFVAGLGPRKAEVIRTALMMAGTVRNRNDLYMRIRALEEKVFTNCAGFIRVRWVGPIPSEMGYEEPLDNTRIHPESYQVARNLAEAAIKEEAQKNDEAAKFDGSQMTVEHVMKNPNILENFDIDEFASAIQVEGQGKKSQTLSLIKSELQRGFKEWRKPYSEPTNEESFYLMTGESEDTLFPGQVVQATVRKVQDDNVMCVLECGLLCFISRDDLSDDADVEPKDKCTEGSSVTCRVKDVRMDKFLVNLTCKESDLRGDLSRNVDNRDKHFKPDPTFILNEQEKARKKKEEKIQKTFKPRPIDHPKFQNFSTEDAVEALAENDVGDFIIRPSSKGPAHLTITLKVSGGLFSHIDVAEDSKDHWDLASFLRLGKTLTIGDDSFNSIDEVITKYINPVVTHLNAMVQFRKYREGSKSEIADALRSQKADNPKIIPYCFSISHDYPGAFMLSYIRATTPLHEYISLEPKGFRFRKKTFDTPEKLVTYFQSHYHDPIPEPTNFAVGGRGRGRGRGERGRGRGGGGGNCFKCGESGHMSRECPNESTEGGGGGRDRSCHKCGESGHMSRECPTGGGGGGGGGDRSCYKCGESGHMSRECPTGGGGGGGGDRNCFKCGESGHMSRECPTGGGGGGGGGGGDRNCFKCGESGHMSRECPTGGGGGGGGGDRNCYKCGESGHMSRECPTGGGGGGGGGDRSCYKCGESGHMSRECPTGGGGGGGDRKCYKCGESGHMSRECPTGGGGGGGDRKCYKCGESGHMSRECPSESNQGGSWNDSTWGNKGGSTGGNNFDTDGANTWNDSAAVAGAEATSEGGNDGWDSWNDPSSKKGGAATTGAGGGGGWDSWGSDAPPTNGGGSAATKAASWGSDAPHNDKTGKACNTESEDNAWGGASNAAGGGGDWDVTDKAGDANVTKTGDVGSAWDSGTKSSGEADGGWGGVPASGGGWDAAGGEPDGGAGGGSNKGRWNENAGRGGEGTKRRGSDQWGSSSQAKRPAPSSWNTREKSPDVRVDQDWGEPASNTATADDGWGSVTKTAAPASNTATTDDGWGSVTNTAGGGDPASNTATADDGWGNVTNTAGAGEPAADDGWGNVTNTAGAGEPAADDGWGSVTNTAGGGGGWDDVPQTGSGAGDLPSGDKGAFSSHDGGNDQGWGSGGARGSQNDGGGRWENRGGRSGSRGGRGGGGGDRNCYKCGESGHMSRECPTGGGGGGGGGGGDRNCYKCGESGHFARECPTGGGGGGGDRKCYKCNESGHMSRECPTGGGGGGGDRKCYKCGESGHMSRECLTGGGGGGGGGDRNCYRCGESGHFARECPTGGGGGGGDRKCYKCNESGHMARECPTGGGGGYGGGGGRGSQNEGGGWGGQGGRGSQNDSGEGGGWGGQGGRGSQNDSGGWGNKSDNWD